MRTTSAIDPAIQAQLQQRGTYYLTINSLELWRTCTACPEQYDAFYPSRSGPRLVGYIRLRWGHLTAQFPDVGGKVVVDSPVLLGPGPNLAGEFPSEESRAFWLRTCVVALELELIDAISKGELAMGRHWKEAVR